MANVTYNDFVNNYLVKDGMLGNAVNLNKAPDQLKKEVDDVTTIANGLTTAVSDINTRLSKTNLDRADKYLSSQNIVNMDYVDGNLAKIRYRVDSDTDYEVFTYTAGELSKIAHYVGGVLKGNSVLSYLDGELESVVFTAV